MRKFFMLALVAAAIGAGTGCDGDGNNTGGSGGDGGSGGTMNTTTTSMMMMTTGAPTTSAPQSCDGILTEPNDCGMCVQDQCCAELLACTDDAECNPCITDPANADPNVCAANSQFSAINDCAAALCSDVCGAAGGQCARYCCDDADCGMGNTCNKDYFGLGDVGLCVDGMAAAACDAPAMSPGMCAAAYDCNPITNEPCNTAGGEACDFNGSGFQCFGPPNEAMSCGDCNNSGGPFCVPGYSCYQPG